MIPDDRIIYKQKGRDAAATAGSRVRGSATRREDNTGHAAVEEGPLPNHIVGQLFLADLHFFENFFDFTPKNAN